MRLLVAFTLAASTLAGCGSGSARDIERVAVWRESPDRIRIHALKHWEPAIAPQSISGYHCELDITIQSGRLGIYDVTAQPVVVERGGPILRVASDPVWGGNALDLAGAVVWTDVAAEVAKPAVIEEHAPIDSPGVIGWIYLEPEDRLTISLAEDHRFGGRPLSWINRTYRIQSAPPKGWQPMVRITPRP